MSAIRQRMALLLAGALVLLPAAALAASPFAGRWDGSWTDAMSGQSGEATVNVGADGQVEGTVRNGSFGIAGPLRGTVADDGAATLRYTYDKGRTTYRAVGSFRSGDGRLTGEVDFLAPNGVQIGHGVFRLAPAQATGRTPADPPPPDAGRTGKARQPVPGKAPGGE